MVSDPKNWDELRQDKDCSNYNKLQEVPVPYDRGEALFRMGDPKKMAKALSKYQSRTKAKIQESYQYVGGNQANGKLNEEYIKNDQVLQKIRERLKLYTGSPEAASDELFRIARQAELEGKSIPEVFDRETKIMDGQTPDVLPVESKKPDGQWVPLSAWEAFQHWLKGGTVEQEQTAPDWRDDVFRKK